MQLGTRAVQVTDDGGHAGLVTEHGGKVDGLLGVILGEAVRMGVSVCCQYPSILIAGADFFSSCPATNAIFLLRDGRVCDRTSSPFRGDGCNASWEGKRANRDGAPRTSCETSLLNVSKMGGCRKPGSRDGERFKCQKAAAVCAGARRVCGRDQPSQGGH